MSGIRPLPPRPSLEVERKRAKALLRDLRGGNADALARARTQHPRLAASAPPRIRLADAQLVIAREYGFASWPRLVRYFGAADRQRHNGRTLLPPGAYDAHVRRLLADHGARALHAERTLAAYVPRFYGKRAEEIFDERVSEDEARLAVARSTGSPSWEVLLERAAAQQAMHSEDDPWIVHPLRRARFAMEAGDLAALERLVRATPELLQRRVQDWDAPPRPGLLSAALDVERSTGTEAMRPIMAWLEDRGLDVQAELDRQLCGHVRMKTEDVRWLLERGADPDAVGPSGIPVLEEAIIRYWNGEAVDLVATRATPREALWIAAGLGDLAGVRRSLDADGTPKPGACRIRPPFDAVGVLHVPSLPDPDAEELLVEALLAAMLNGRANVIELMVSRRAPVNSRIYGEPLLNLAVGNLMTPMVDCLVRCGADLDLRGLASRRSPREHARAWFEQNPRNADRQRIAALCGVDVDAVRAELDARPVHTPPLHPETERALSLAADDAIRLGQPDVGPENLLFGLLRCGGLPLLFFTRVSRMDLDRFRSDVAGRVDRGGDGAAPGAAPLHSEARAILEAAIASATDRRREAVRGVHLLFALLRAPHSPAVAVLARYGADVGRATAELQRVL